MNDPGTRYAVNQMFPSLRWRAVSIPEAQGIAMKERGEKHIYTKKRQAMAVVTRLNKKHDR